MMPRAEFGRRGEAAPGRKDKAGETSTAAEKSSSKLSDEQRASIRKVLWAAPLILTLVAVPMVLVKLSGGIDCTQKPAGQRGLFDINWCQAGMAAVQGAARGVSSGAGARGPR